MGLPDGALDKENVTPEELRLVRQKLSIGPGVAKLNCPDSAIPLAKNIRTMTPKEWRASTDEEKLNKTERAYLAYLRAQNYPWIGIQNVTLKLAFDTRLTVDFVVLDTQGGLTFVDVKGFQREDALIKMRMAARLFPFWTFQIVKRNGYLWEHETVKP